MTGNGFSHTLNNMDLDFASLEKKVDQVVAFCRALRDENHSLRDRVSGLEEEKAALAGKIEQARLRLESLMERLPAE